MVSTPSTRPDPGLFRIPAVAIARHPGVLLGAREIRRWMETLPLANPPKAGQMLLQQLRLLVHDPEPGSRLGTLLALYAAPVEQLVQIVHERIRNNPDSATPLDQLEYLVCELLNELAIGQLRIANGLLAAGKTPPAEILFQAMDLLESALNIERLHYHSMSSESWQQILSVFLRAEYQQIAGQAVKSATAGDDPDNVRGLFFRALLISLCDPQHHRPGEILSWYRWTGRYAQLLELTVLPQGAAAIPLDISGSLLPLASARRGRPGPDTQYLATDRFLAALQDDEAAPEGLHRALTDLIRGRKAPEQRKAERQRRSHPYRLLFGLRNIHQRLNEITRGDTTARQAVAPVPCEQIDHSRFGSAFRLQLPVNPPLCVGEPVLAEAESTAANGSAVGFAACVQRLVSDDGHLVVGVEKLQGRLIPVLVVGGAAERTRGDNHGLLQHASDEDRYTLIASRSVYRQGDVLSVEGPNSRYKLRMLRVARTAQHTAFIEAETTEV